MATLSLPVSATLPASRGRSISTNASGLDSSTPQYSLKPGAHHPAHQLHPHQIRYARSFESGLPSLSYASSSGASFSDVSPRMRALSDAFSTDDTTWDSAHEKDQSYDTSKSSDQVVVPPPKRNTPNLANSPSLNRILDQVKTPDSSPEPSERQLPSLMQPTPLPAPNRQRTRKHKRIRVESNPAMLPLAGFPYRNSTNLLSHRYVKSSVSSENLRQSSAERNRASRISSSSGNSSDDVDLDLSWEPAPLFRRADHIGIDMSRLALDQEDDFHLWPNQGAVNFEEGGRLAYMQSVQGRSRCRSTGDLNLGQSPSSGSVSSASPIMARFSTTRSESLPQSVGHTSSDLELASGWCYNRTSAVDTGQRAIVDMERATAQAESLRERRQRGPISPIKFFFDKVIRSPNASPTLTSSTLTPGLSNEGERRFPTNSNLSSPTNTDGIFTPRSIHGELFDTIQISDEAESEGRIPHSNSKALSNSSTFSTYQTGRSVPFSLMAAVETAEDTPGTQHVTWHTPRMESQDLTEFLAPVPERPALPQWTSVSEQQQTGLLGLGLQDVDMHRDRQYAPVRPPRSPSLVGSPSPNSPLLGVLSPVPRITFSEYQEQHLQSRDNVPKSDLLGKIKTIFHLSSRSDIPIKHDLHRPRTPSDRSLSPFNRNEPHLSLVEDVSPAKGLFFAAFMLGPWCWLYAALMLRPDGELFGTRAGYCRCHRSASPKINLSCPADIHRALRLNGVQATGQGLHADMAQITDQDKLALLNIDMRKQHNHFVLANRVLACGAGLTISACFIVAVYEVALAW